MKRTFVEIVKEKLWEFSKIAGSILSIVGILVVLAWIHWGFTLVAFVVLSVLIDSWAEFNNQEEEEDGTEV